jgi:citrate synthase
MTEEEKNRREPFHWRTAISYKTRDEIIVRGYDINELTGEIDFASMAYLTWTGSLPSEPYRKMLNAVLVSLAEHAFSPSSAACRFVRSGGTELNTAVAGGILTIGSRHASADVPAAMFQEAVARAKEEGITLEEKARQTVSAYRQQKKILNGYHHPQHIRDPRAPRLLALAAAYGADGEHVQFAKAVEAATEEVYGRIFYLNAPGAAAAVCSDMNMNPEQIKGLMILSRTVSLIAHSIEEAEREKGWRASGGSEIIQPLDLSLQGPEYYDGPGKRTLNTKNEEEGC